jgi:hypothetical protein
LYPWLVPLRGFVHNEKISRKQHVGGQLSKRGNGVCGVPTDGTRLPIDGKRDFGSSPFCRQLSGKQALDLGKMLYSSQTTVE